MKTPPTREVDVLVGSRIYRGPHREIRTLLTALKRMHFQEMQPYKEEGISWEALAAERIMKFSSPGLALRGARLRAEMTQADLSKKIKVPQYNISKMENGTRSIGKQLAKRLARVFGLDYRVFL